MDNKKVSISLYYFANDVPTVYSGVPTDLEWTWLEGTPPGPATAYAAVDIKSP